MKKVKIHVYSLVLGMSFLAGCGTTHIQNKDNQLNTSSISAIETNPTQSADSAIETSKINKSINTNNNNDTFNSIIANMQPVVELAKSKYGQVYQNITIKSGADHTIIYTLKFKKTMPVLDYKALKPIMAKSLKTEINTLKAAFPDVKIQTTYLNPNGAKVAEFVITPADIEKVSPGNDMSLNKTSLNTGNDDKFNLAIEAAQLVVDSYKEKYSNVFKDVNITAGENHTIIYTLIFKQSVPVNKEEIIKSKLKPLLEKEMKPGLDKIKLFFPDVKMQFRLLNPNGSKVADFFITPWDVDNARKNIRQ